ncbi:hypothetical protein HDU93_006318, partial [Gonapodya sp. JEL0774]
MLDSVRRSATSNTLYYVMSTTGDVLAISGLGNSTVQSKTLKKVIDPVYGVFALNTIFDYDAAMFPLLNKSALAVLQYTGGNLSSSFPDNTWQYGNHLISVRSVILSGYRYIVVTAAPLEDYLGDTIYLVHNLNADAVTKMIEPTAFAIVLVTSIFAITFVWFFISKPLTDILATMKKATKFDFSDLRNGQLKSRKSVVNEIQHLQENFTEMVKVFASALK